MKKIIFGILSILLISPVFAEEISLNGGPHSFISFEDLKSSHNITYGFYRIGGSYSTYEKSFTYYLNSSLVPQYSINYFDSTSTQSWVNYNTDLGSPFVISGNSYITLSNQGNYYGLLGIGFINGRLINNSFSAYFQSDDGLNKVINFSSQFNTGINFTQVNHSFVRALYNYSSSSGLWFLDNNSPVISSVGPPTNIQLFNRNDDRVYTSKGMAGINQTITKVSSSVGNGFSFFPLLSGSITWDSLKMFSVFPYWDSDFSGTFYTIPSSKYSSDFYIFKMNSLGRNTDYGHIGVISKCNISICSGFDLQSYLSSLVFSEYYCDFSSNFGIKNNCNLVDGGFLYNVLGSVTGLNSVIDINSLPNFLGNIQYYYKFPSVGVNFNFSNRSLIFSYWTYPSNSYSTPPGIYSSSFPVSYTGIYSSTYVPDILGTYDYVNPLPPTSNSSGSITTGTVTDVLDNICKTAIVKPPFCQNGGLVDLSGDLEGMWYVDLSGNLVYTIIGTDPDNLGSFDLVPNGSGGFDVICTDDLFGCTLSDNLGLSGATIGGSSGFILSSDYYEEFFTKTGYWGKCPYPYTDINVGLHSKFLNKIGDKLGFDVFLPVNCSIAAFTYGKNYKFLSDVNLGLSPLMGQIQRSDDPRVYLYRFFDFLLSLFLIVFLLKLYHLLN